MKTLILVPVWRRPEVTNIFAVSLAISIPANCEVLCILSKEDEFYKENMETLEPFGFNIGHYKNMPLGKKMNAGIETALDNYDFDYLMNLGSDDLIHSGIWFLYNEFLKFKLPFFGLEKVYFYEMKTGKLARSLPYYWGAGRMISREIIEKMRKNGKYLYKNEYSKGLDCNSIDNIKKELNIDYKQVDTNDFPYLIDLKTWDSLNDFNMFSRLYEIVNPEILDSYYPKIITDLLHE